jgi:hypothetical protein
LEIARDKVRNVDLGIEDDGRACVDAAPKRFQLIVDVEMGIWIQLGHARKESGDLMRSY